MIDYELLGALIGSAWRENHRTKEGWREARASILYHLDPPSGEKYHKFRDAMERTMLGYCAFCGTASEVGRDERGIYCCETCVGC